MGFCNIGADGITMSICNSIWLLFGQSSFNLAFCCYLKSQFFNWASVPGERNSNATPAQSPVVACYIFITIIYLDKTLYKIHDINL